jgi:hypothetical protein
MLFPRILAAMGLAALFALCGCTGTMERKYSENPSNPWAAAGIERVLVFPFFDSTGDMKDQRMEFSELFASELTTFDGFVVLRPHQALTAAMGKDRTPNTEDDIGKLWDPRYDLWQFSLRDVMRIAQVLNVDAIIACEVTEYSQYPPPRIAVNMQIYTNRSIQHSATDLDKLTQSGKPYAITRGGASHVLLADEWLIDTHWKAVREEIIGYARNHVEGETSLTLDEEFTRDHRRFFSFCANYLMRKAMDRWDHVQRISAAPEESR